MPISKIAAYTGIFPNADTQTDEEYATNVFLMYEWIGKTALVSFNAATTEIDTVVENIDASVTQVTNDKNTVAQDKQIATDKAAEALVSANAAQAAQEAAETIYDTFDDKWLGTKDVEPTLDNDGDPLQDGAIYIKRKADAPNEMYVYDLEKTVWVNMNFVPTAHSSLSGVNDSDIHPMSSITGLVDALANISTEPTQADLMALT